MGLCFSPGVNEARFQYTNRDGQSKVLYLGRMPRKAAQHHEVFLKKLVASHLNPGIGDDPVAIHYADSLPARLRKMLVKHGLIPPSAEETKDQSMFLGELIEKYLDYHRADKENTFLNIKMACDKLTRRFGADKRILDISAADTNHFEKFLYQNYAEATASRLVKRFRQLMTWAITHGFCKENIFRTMRVGKQENKARLEYVSIAKVRQAADVCVNFELRIALYLARFMALRVPSEINSLKWSFVDFEGKKIKIMDTKRGECRVVPLFESVYPVLSELLMRKECKAFLSDLQKANINLEEALNDWQWHGHPVTKLLQSRGTTYIAEMTSRLPKGEDYVFSSEFRSRKSRSNQMSKLKRKAGVFWTKDFQNLRASCESDWVAEYGIRAATSWSGNSISVAEKHYMMVTPDIWAKATGEESSENKTAETLRAMLKTLGAEKIKAVLEGLSNENM